MRHHLVRLVIVVCLATSNGCLAKQFKRDGASSQEAVSEIYTEQAMNNLVRARCNLPFVQLKYDAIAVNDQDHLTATGGFNQVFTAVRDIVLGTGTNTLANSYSVGGTADRNRIMSFTSVPITDQNDIYESYLLFANDPGLFCVSDHAPTCPVHLHRKCGKKHFWVPVEAGPAFLNLVMKTAIMRGPETIPPGFYAVEIVGLPRLTQNPAAKDQWTGIVEFKPAIPNGDATLTFKLASGKRVRLHLDKWTLTKKEKADQEEQIRDGQPTTKLRISWNATLDGISEKDLPPGLKVRIYSYEYPPEAITPDPMIRRIATDINEIKVLQNLNRGH